MAIVKALPGFEVTVVVDGAPLTEYTDDSKPDQERNATRYIEAVSDQVFEIHVKAQKGAEIQGDALEATVFVDGKFATAPIITKDKVKHADFKAVRMGVRLSSETMRKFSFASIDTADDRRAFKWEEKKLKELGSIRLKLYFVLKGSRDRNFKPHNTEDLGIISEKALALQDRPISHSVGLRPAVQAGSSRKWNTSKVDKGGSSDCTIVFHYASKTSLQYAGIIPRTPSPPPLEDKEDLTRDEMKQLQAQIKAMKRERERLVEIKKEDEPERKRQRKIAQPKAGDTQLVLGDDGDFSQQSTAGLGNQQAAPIEISSGEEDSEED